jgi:hypothetical protein
MRRLAVSLVCASLVGATRAQADGNDEAAAEALFLEGRALMEGARFDEACAKFEASERVSPALGTLMNLADCEEKRGRIATAWAYFRDAALQAQQAGRADRKRVAEARALDLEARSPKVVIVAQRPAASVDITRDGKRVDAAVFGTALPIDPGEHRVEANAPGRVPWVRTFRAVERELVKVEIPELALAAPRGAPVPTAASTASADAGHPGLQKTIGWIATGVGVVGIGASGALGLHARSLWNEAHDSGHCIGDTCDPTGASQASDARTFGSFATIAFVAGAVALAAGVYLVLSAPKGARAAMLGGGSK